MQLYALDSKGLVISATRAFRQSDYSCVECNQIVRLRAGAQRQAHFYHLAKNPHCKMNGKSMEHLQTQCYIASQFSAGEIELEKHFPKVSRIADACWEKQKIIFEVQCSPISSEEVLDRNKDYAAIGYKVIWILHDKQFKKRGSPVVKQLEFHPHYYTNMDAEGKGSIYDKAPLGAFAIDVSQYKAFLYSKDLFPNFSKRLENWSYYFSGEFIDCCLKNPSLMETLQSPKKFNADFHFFNVLFHKWIVRPYLLLFQIILEKSCR